MWVNTLKVQQLNQSSGSTTNMKIACIQMDIVWENPKENFLRAARLIKSAARKGATCICLPELFETGVTMNSKRFAETLEGETCAFLSRQAKEHGVYVIGSFILSNENNMPYNSVVVYDNTGELITNFSKIHVFSYNNEQEGYSSGTAISSFTMDKFNIVPFICYDLRFPELFRLAVNKGANTFVIAANWPNPRKDHWITLLRARAIENQAYVIGINRVGKSPEHSFFGSSMIISPKGEIVIQGGDKEEVVIGDISLKEIAEWRQQFPALKDRVNYSQIK